MYAHSTAVYSILQQPIKYIENPFAISETIYADGDTAPQEKNKILRMYKYSIAIRCISIRQKMFKVTPTRKYIAQNTAGKSKPKEYIQQKLSDAVTD